MFADKTLEFLKASKLSLKDVRAKILQHLFFSKTLTTVR